MQFPAVQQKIQELTPGSTEPFIWRSVGGGSINQSYQIRTSGSSYFCKVNSATKFPHLFLKEKAGLETLATQGRIRTPRVLDCFESGGQQFLLMEWIAEGDKTKAFWKAFGGQLAAMHSTAGTGFGWQEDNYMGSVVQTNIQDAEWISFFIQQRLQPMVAKCSAKKLLSSKEAAMFESLYLKLDAVFGTAQLPVLLHGDLWSGNFMCDENGTPVLIDPAVYFGHPAVDLGMTTLFGGFDNTFYEAYHYHSELPSNYEEQWQVCNLYPLLIHLYLFGSSYRRQIVHTLQQFA